MSFTFYQRNARSSSLREGEGKRCRRIASVEAPGNATQSSRDDAMYRRRKTLLYILQDRADERARDRDVHLDKPPVFFSDVVNTIHDLS
ncbi:MAG: hypothetical protein ACKO96_24050, partial [Flammeovirgaceae bacterium]